MRSTVSICIPYYEDPHRLYSVLHNEWLSWFDEIIIVDDASSDFPAPPIVENAISDELIIGADKISVYRIQEDYGFNAHGARNLAAQQSTSEWLFFLDVDLRLDEDFMAELAKLVDILGPQNYILCNLFGGDPGNIFCVRREDFQKAGGYDEELRGYHMGDKIFRERLDSFCLPHLMDAILPCDRMGRKVYEDDSITGTLYPDDHSVVQRKQIHIQDQLDMIEQRNQEPELWESIPKIQFEWDKVI